jgi:hypothetical protein
MNRQKITTFLATVVFAVISMGSLTNLNAEGSGGDLSIGTLSYLSYETVLDPDDGLTGGAFKVNRSYLTVKKDLFKHLSFRITVDAHQDDAGDMKARLKYVYAHYKFDDFGFITKPNIEFGLVHMPWLDFEEHVNYYRMQGTMFMERAGLFNSADFGLTFGGYFGGELDDEYKKKVNKKYAGRYGSFALGIYNGGGYHALEEVDNKTIEGRLTVRPIPDILPGLQLSYFGIFGSGNHEYELDTLGNMTEPEWQVNTAMLSYEHQYFTVAGQYVSGKGNQKGKYVDENYDALSIGGFSAFAEAKLGENWRIIGRFDNFDPNTDMDDDEYSRIIAGVGYDFGGHNILILDLDNKMYEAEGKDNETKIKLTMQVHF